MRPVDLVRVETEASLDWLEAIVSDVTPELAGWQPPGLANGIAATYAHLLISADVDVNRHFRGGEPLIAAGWGERLGLAETFPDTWPDVVIDWSALRAYGRAVRQRLLDDVSRLTQSDLDRTFQMIPKELGTWKGIDVYVLHGMRHPRLHGGEIACLKGVRGRRGYGGSLGLYPS